MTTKENLSQEEYEQELKEQSEKYNTELKELYGIQDEINSLKNQAFLELQQLYDNFKIKQDANESKYHTILKELEDKKNKLLEKTTSCFLMLQQLRNKQNTYLVGIINGKQAKVQELESELQKLKSGTSSNRVRTDNL